MAKDSVSSLPCFPVSLGPGKRIRAVASLVLGDVVLSQGAVLLGVYIRGLLAPILPISWGASAFIGIHVATLFLPLAYAVAGLYPGYGLSPIERVRKRVLLVVVGCGLVSAFDYLALAGQWSRGILLIATALGVVLLPLWDIVAGMMLARRGWWGEPVVVFGPPERAAAVARGLEENSGLGWIPQVMAMWPPDPAAIPPGVDMVILAPPQSGPPLHLVNDRLPIPRVMVIPDLGDVQSLGVFARDTGAGLGLEMRRNLLRPTSAVIKRACDLAAIVLLLPLLLVVIALIVAVVKLVCPGPAFYAQMREGMNGRMFCLWKIRSMVVDADEKLADILGRDENAREEWLRHMKLAADPRVIPWIGTIIRRFSLDELPQFINVLRGEMSLVGPRPLPPYHVEVLPTGISELRRRVRPGITGLAQISGRSDRSVTEQAVSDAYYIRNWSLWIDYFVILQTGIEVLRGRGAY